MELIQDNCIETEIPNGSGNWDDNKRRDWKWNPVIEIQLLELEIEIEDRKYGHLWREREREDMR